MNKERKELLICFWTAMDVLIEEQKTTISKVVGNNTSIAKNKELNPTLDRMRLFSERLNLTFTEYLKKLTDEMEKINDSKR